MATQKAENNFLADSVEWSPLSDSRPSSGLYSEIQLIVFSYPKLHSLIRNVLQVK